MTAAGRLGRLAALLLLPALARGWYGRSHAFAYYADAIFGAYVRAYCGTSLGEPYSATVAFADDADAVCGADIQSDGETAVGQSDSKALGRADARADRRADAATDTGTDV